MFSLLIVRYIFGLILILEVTPSRVHQHSFTTYRGGVIRGDIDDKNIALLFSGDEYGEGLKFIRTVLKKNHIQASFFFTGRFYRHKKFLSGIKALARDGHFMGAHSDQHLLYCDWSQRDSLLVTRQQFTEDLLHNYEGMKQAGVKVARAKYFLPPYEWYNDTISSWANTLGIQLINFTPGTLSHTDYTTLNDKNYRDNKQIYESIVEFEKNQKHGLNGFMLLMHIGAGPARREKFYTRLPELISLLRQKGYQFKPVDELLK